VSFFETECPMCGLRYYTGMVGMTLMGSHECAYQGFWPLVAHWNWFCVHDDDGVLRTLRECAPGMLTGWTWPG
jgi:hypothetical protein